MLSPKQKILFLCTGNSCRSQMAEAWARHLLPDVEPYSAGIRPSVVDPLAIAVMRDVGIDMSGQRSKHLDELNGINFDLVVTVCSEADESCPVFPGKTKKIHRGFDDPPGLSKKTADIGEKKEIYRRVRDEIREFVKSLPSYL